MRIEFERYRGMRRLHAVRAGLQLVFSGMAFVLAGVVSLVGAGPAVVGAVMLAGTAWADDAKGETPRPFGFAGLGADATLAEIEACATRNLPGDAGRIEFSVEAVDRSGVVTASRAEIRWRQDEAEQARIVLRVSEPAKTAGTALLIIDRESDQPEFFLRLPELPKVKRVRSRRLRGPVLGTDFSFEDLQRLREPIDETALELIGLAEVEGRPSWLLEALPNGEGGGSGDSEYSRVLTYVDQASCLPIQIDLFEGDDRLRKRLHAPAEEIRSVRASSGASATGTEIPHVFVMEDLKRETRTVVRVEHFESKADWPAEQFTKRALERPPSSVDDDSGPPAAVAPARPPVVVPR